MSIIEARLAELDTIKLDRGSMNDDDRQMLKPYIPRIVGTRTTGKDEKTRAWMCTDWLARECAPAWLRLAGLTAQAEALEGLAPLTSAASARKAQPTLDAARKETAAAGDAAGPATRAAAWNVAWNAAWDAAGAAARAAARAALAETVEKLQPTVLALLDRMIEVGKEPATA